MAISESELKKKIKAYIDKEGSGYKNWYAGITSDPKRRLEEHGVKALGVYGWANTVDVARRVEEYLIGLGCDGAPGGGDKDSKAVYAYKKTKDTTP